MKKHFLSSFFVTAILISIPGEAITQINGFNKIKWEREKIAPGLKWKSTHTLLNDSIPQNINILIINLNKRKISLEYSPLKNVPASIQAQRAGAFAAVNAGFFDVKRGGSVTYLKVAGKIADVDTAKKWIRNPNMNGAVLIRSSETVCITKRMVNSWFDSHSEYEDILVTGPLLVEGGSLTRLPETSLVINKHPRSAVGTRNNRKVLFIAVDGRAEEAAGMTLYELAEVMRLLKCRDAVNLDGGGSTTMWIEGMPFDGVVNMPSDNKKWDHEGERAVSNILIVK
jgi:exopolysaccharide biosynthesis protein